MKESRFKTIVLVAAHVAIAAAMVVGYETSILFLKQFFGSVSTNAQSISSIIKQAYERILQIDQYVLYGVLGALLLVAYDIKLTFSWFSGFRFSGERQCKHCKIKTIRAERQPLDRVLSVVYPVKRFICLGCGRQYLMSDRKHVHQADTVLEGEFAAAHSTPKRARNRFR